MESEIKKNLSDLTQIPQKEFEKHFSEWMARDDVARSLQAKLRTDLIKNFNQTHLGKQILSQTTSKTGYGASTQRLTLSPLILALNTLVAEFLYAQNCHFSLSVFCTEIPFRNTLPDFESSRWFRFSQDEILDIVDAISSSAKLEKDFKNTICKDYTSEPNCSLLLLVLKQLLTARQQPTTATKETYCEFESKPQPSITWNESVQTDAQHDEKTAATSDRDFLNLSKYLIILSKKVNEMTQQFEQLQQCGVQKKWCSKTMPRPRIVKCKRQRKYENLNQSLERIVENLKEMSQSKRKSKRLAAILTAIEGMATQFEKCSTRFEQFSEVLLLQADTAHKAKAHATHEATQTMEKSYIEWVHEMRTTKNGEHFLKKVEQSLAKALEKQKLQLEQEAVVKLLHQKELLKLRYKQKLMEKWNKNDTLESSVVLARTDSRCENIEKQLREFEVKHSELLNKIRFAEECGNQQQNGTNHTTKVKSETCVTATQTKDSQTEVLKTARGCQSDESLLAASYKQKNVSKNVVDAKSPNAQKSEAECNGSHLVCDAKMRMLELEHESNQLEQSFRNYLERQQLQKEVSRHTAETMWNNYAFERNQIENQLQMTKHLLRNQFIGRSDRRRRSLELSNDADGEYSEMLFRGQLKGCNLERVKGAKHNGGAAINSPQSSSSESNEIVFKNAIQEAKSKLFDQQTFKLRKSENYEQPLMPKTNLNLSDYNNQLLLPMNGSADDPSERELPLAALDLTKSEMQLRRLQQQDCNTATSTDYESDGIKAEKQTSATATENRSSGQHKAKKALHFDSFNVRKKSERDKCHVDSASEENHQEPQQQLKEQKDSAVMASAFKVANQHKSKENGSSANLGPSSSVLQQSMAKMNKLFGELQEKPKGLSAVEVNVKEHRDHRTATNQSKAAAGRGPETTAATETSTTETGTTTLEAIQRYRYFDKYTFNTTSVVTSTEVASAAFPRQDDDYYDDGLSNGDCDDGEVAAAPSKKYVHQSENKMEKKKFNAIEKSKHSTKTMIEMIKGVEEMISVPPATTISLPSTTTTEKLMEDAIKSKQNMRSKNYFNEAQLFNVDNQRIGNNNELSECRIRNLRMPSMDFPESNSTSYSQSTRRRDDEQQQQVAVEIGEITDDFNAAASSTFVDDDNQVNTAARSSSSTMDSSFELEKRVAKSSSSSDFWG